MRRPVSAGEEIAEGLASGAVHGSRRRAQRAGWGLLGRRRASLWLQGVIAAGQEGQMLPTSYALETYTRAHLDMRLTEARRQRSGSAVRPAAGEV